MKTAILVDGGFYRKRAECLFGFKTAEQRAEELESYCRAHLREKKNSKHKPAYNDLYRIFYYDCPPSARNIYHPLFKRSVDLKQDPLYSWSTAFFEELKCKRKFALRMGHLSDVSAQYCLRQSATKQLLSNRLTIDELTERDFYLDLTQKGVDMRIGIDIASLALKSQVDQIVLISGDCDFVPAAKFARREGIDFILDPMLHKIDPELNEHIDGIRTKCHMFMKNKKQKTAHADGTKKS